MILRGQGLEGYPDYYQWLLSERFAPATRVASLFVIALNTFFFALDAWVYSERLVEFAVVRLAWSASMVVVYAATYKFEPLACVRAGCVVAGLFLIGLSALGGGVTSPYWPALLILFLGMPVLMPITAGHAAGIVSFLTVCFAVQPVIAQQVVDLPSYTVSVFFVVGAAIECIASAAVLDGMRLADFKSRIEIEAARDHLREMDAAKSRFTSNVHHELRTPLTLILSPLAALQSGEYGELPEDLRNITRTMEVNGKRLHKLINNLLDLAKLEGHQFAVTRSPLILRDLVEDVLLGVTPFADRKGVSVCIGGFEDMPILNADRDALDKVLLNLVGNALKFTEDGGTVEIWAGRVEAGTRLEVRDSGVGIPPEQLSRVFDRFAQVDGSTTRKFEGTGIGLSLAFELVELHAGRIWAESDGEGFGTTMCVELPVGVPDDVETDASDAVISGHSSSSDEENGKKAEVSGVERSIDRYSVDRELENDDSPFTPGGLPRVVVADDNPDMRDLLRFVLSKDYQVRFASNGREALDLIHADRPDIVLTDVMMPEMSGTELCDRLKSDEVTSDLPVVLVTSKADQEMKVKGLQLGADDYVTKPFHPRELLARVGGLVHVHQLQEELRIKNESLESALSELRSTQNVLVESERRAAVGELAAGVAHEVNNPVNFSLNAARAMEVEVEAICDELLEASSAAVPAIDDDSAPSRLKESVSAIRELSEIVEEGLMRTARLVGDLRDFASPSVGETERVDLVDSIEGAIGLVSPTYAPKGVSFELFKPDRCNEVRGNAAQLNQVLLNLLKNAAQAIGDDGGVVKVEVDSDLASIVVRVVDDGPGLAPEAAEKAFDAFFTTKPCGAGTGLGLPTSRRIVEEHGGSLDLVSSGPSGTTFQMVLEAAETGC